MHIYLGMDSKIKLRKLMFGQTVAHAIISHILCVYVQLVKFYFEFQALTIPIPQPLNFT